MPDLAQFRLGSLCKKLGAEGSTENPNEAPLNDLRLNLSYLIVSNSKVGLKTLFIFNWIMLVMLFASFTFLLLDIQKDIITYGMSYNVTTIINNVETTEEIFVADKYSFAFFLAGVNVISILNVVHFRGKLNELQEV